MFRCRLVNFATSCDEMISLPAELQFNILKKSMAEIIFLAKIWGFNVKHVNDEIGLVFSDVDISQFQVPLSLWLFIWQQIQ